MPASGKPTSRRPFLACTLLTRSGRAAPSHNFSLEALEPRTLLYAWTAEEVYFSELVNRARANPLSEADRLGLNFSTGLNSSEQALLTPHEPLALSASLTQASRLHGADMAARSFFDHTNPDGLTPTNRAVAAGYAGTAGENIGANYSTIDALYYSWMNTPTERKNLLSLYTTFDATYHYDHIGPGFQLNVTGALYPNYYTVDFGNPSSQSRTPWLLGVVFSDTSNDNFYSIGEGSANIRIDVFPGSTTTGTPTATYTTDAAGNYQLPLTNGSYSVVFTRPSDNYRIVKTATISGQNVRLTTKTSELAPPPPPPDDFADAGAWSSAGLITINQTTGSGSRSGTLGIAGDTDLFVFTAAKTGITRISGIPTSAAYDGRIRIYNSAQSLIANGIDGSNVANSVADVSLTAGSTYYILFSATNNTSTGAYNITIEGPPPPPDDFANSGQWSTAGLISINSTSASGSISGTLGVSADTDLFTFTSARTGTTTITGSPNSAAYDGRIQIYDAAHTLIASGTDGTAATDSVATLSLTSGATYFILFSATSNTSTGNYTISIDGPPPPPPPTDDFADADDWSNAGVIDINATSGSGSRSGILEVASDSDLFTFTATQTGSTTLAAIAGSGLTARLRVYDGLHNLLATGDPGTGGASANSIATLNLTTGQIYYLLIDSADVSQTGTYTAQVTGPDAPPPPPPDDFADAEDWASAAAIDLNSTTGNGSRTGSIEVSTDSDLFTFIAVKAGLTSIAASISSGGTLAARIRLYDSSHALIATGSPGTNGLDSILSATLTAGARYYILIDSADIATTGDYTIQLIAPAIPQQYLTTAGAPANDLWLQGRPVVSFVNQLGRPIVALRTPQGLWTSTDIQTASISPTISGDLQTWIDSRDGLLYAAARSSVGVIVYKRAANGQWSYRNLTAEIAVSRNIVSNLTTFTDSGGLRQIGGIDASGHLVTYWMTGLMWPQGWRYFYTDITSRDLARRSRPMPAFGGTLTSYVTQKNSLNIIGTNPAGQVILFFRPGGGLATQLWNWTNLSTLTGAAALVGNITATETSNRIVNISGTDASGNLWMITWRNGEGWRSRNVTATTAGSSQLTPGSVTSWINSSGAGFVAGITGGGDIVLYRYTLTGGQNTWSFASISAGVVNAPRPTGALRATITSTGSILIAGSTSTGEVVRFTFDTTWTAESISQLLGT